MNRRWSETLAGKRIVAVIAIVAAVGFVVAAVVRPDPFADKKTVWAQFDSVNGLGSIDRDIRVAGVNSGKIGDVKRVGDDALVELEIEGDVVVHEDAEVALRPHTLFEGSAFVDLHPGSPSAPEIAEGGTIPYKHTRVYVSLDEALRVLDDATRESFQDLLQVGGEATGGKSIEALQRTLKASPELTQEITPGLRALQGPEGTELSQAIAGAAKTVDALARRESSLIPLAERTNRTLAGLDVDGGAPLDRALAALPGPLETLSERGDQVTALVDRLDRLSVALRPALVQLAPTLSQVQPILRAATPATRRALPLVSGIGTIMDRAYRAAPGLENLFRILAPAGRLLEENVLPAFNRDSRLGLPTYLQLISGFAGGNATLRPYQTQAQGTLGSGHFIRLGAYFDPAGTAQLAGSLPCDDIALLSPDIADALDGAGMCAP